MSEPSRVVSIFRPEVLQARDGRSIGAARIPGAWVQTVAAGVAAIALAGLVGVILMGHCTYVHQVRGVLTSAPSGDRATEAIVPLTDAQIGVVKPGDEVAVSVHGLADGPVLSGRVVSFSAPESRATLEALFGSAVIAEDGAHVGHIALRPPLPSALRTGMATDVVLSRERRPILEWIFPRLRGTVTP